MTQSYPCALNDVKVAGQGESQPADYSKRSTALGTCFSSNPSASVMTKARAVRAERTMSWMRLPCRPASQFVTSYRGGKASRKLTLLLGHSEDTWPPVLSCAHRGARRPFPGAGGRYPWASVESLARPRCATISHLVAEGTFFGGSAVPAGGERRTTSIN